MALFGNSFKLFLKLSQEMGLTRINPCRRLTLTPTLEHYLLFG